MIRLFVDVVDVVAAVAVDGGGTAVWIGGGGAAGPPAHTPTHMDRTVFK